MCRPRGPGSKRSWLAETGPYHPGLFQIRTTNYPRPPAGVGTGGPWDLQAPYLNRGPLQAQGCRAGSRVEGAWAAGRHSWATISWTLEKAVWAARLNWGPCSLVLSVWYPCLPGQVARGGIAWGGPGGWEGRPGTLCRGPLPVKPSRAGGVHTGAGNHWRPGLLGTQLHGRASSLPQEDGIFRAPGAVQYAAVCRSQGLPKPGSGPGVGRAKPPGAVGRHPWAGLLPPGRATHSLSGRARAAPRE